MHKSLIALAGAASIGLVSVAATPSPANAWCVGCAIGAGIVGGLAAGAIVGSAVSEQPVLLSAPARLLLPATSARLLSAASRGLLRAACRRGCAACARTGICSAGARLSLGKAESLGRRCGLSGAKRSGLPLIAPRNEGINRPACISRPVCFCAGPILLIGREA